MSGNDSPQREIIRLKKTDWLIIGSLWILVQLIILFTLGIDDKGESLKYTGIADDWLKGIREFNLYSIFYSGYIAIHVLLRFLGIPSEGMYAVQLFFSGLALFYFVKILCLFLRSHLAILITALLYASCFIIQEWVRFLYTDSIFSSLLILATYFLLTENKSDRNKYACWFLLIVLPFFRPVGFLFIGLACFHWLVLSVKKNTYKLIFCMCYIILIGLVVNKTFSDKEPYYYPIHSLHNIQANIICGYPGGLIQYQKTPYQEGMPVFYFLLKNPEMTTRLFLSRFYKVFSMSRPYFSQTHNLLLTLFTCIYCMLAGIGIFSILQKRKKDLYFLPVAILLFAFPLVIFCVEWSGRFSLPVYCYVLLLSGIGIEMLIQKWYRPDALA